MKIKHDINLTNCCYDSWGGLSQWTVTVPSRDAGAIAGQGGSTRTKGTGDYIQQIFIILFPNHVLLILLGIDFVLIRRISVNFEHKVSLGVFSGWNTVANIE